ncbi:3-oxoacyl-ACP synthase [Algibacter sp. 2305UL17-15]|uniref:3-oxoacyl-ACP synthase n=1 Tax=Algibacter sp. 2305UL17-15 TaxID=3231268 RepID=UPI0034589DAE
MKKNQSVIAYCHIKNNAVTLNGNTVLLKDSQIPFAKFSKQVYKEKGLAYPKFFKMDNLSKLAFLAAEFLLENNTINPKDKENIAIVLSNKSASLDTDRRHQETINDIENYYPSPAVFVYTLPNIAIGEISIRHRIKGENAFFVSNNFNEKLMEQYALSLIQNEKSKHILCGWVDFDDDNYHAFMYLVAEEGDYNYSQEFIKKIYNEN